MPQDREQAAARTADHQLATLAERATEVEGNTWQTRRATPRAHGPGAPALRHRERSADYSVAYALVGAALGYAIGRTIHSYSGEASWAPRGRQADAIATLNHLIQISRDGERGFQACADGVTEQALKDELGRRAQRCAEGAAELERDVRALGGEPAHGTTFSGSLHRRWVDLKAAITGMDDVAVLSECERGEDVAKEAYKRALESGLPPRSRSVVERQYREVRQNHDRVRALRNARAGSATR